MASNNKDTPLEGAVGGACCLDEDASQSHGSQQHKISSWKEDDKLEFEYFYTTDIVQESSAAWEKCEKHKDGHAGFIPVGEFGPQHLPPELRDKLVLDYIKCCADLTARLRITHDRSIKHDHNIPKSGSDTQGLTGSSGTACVVRVEYIKKGSYDRISEEIETQGHNKDGFWRIYLSTADHCVYDEDDTEAKNVRVDFFFDSEDSRKNEEIKTTDETKTYFSLKNTDTALLVCTTQDDKLGKYLLRVLTKRKGLVLALNMIRLFSTSQSTTDVIISHPHSQPKVVTVGVEVDSYPYEKRDTILDRFLQVLNLGHSKLYDYSTKTCNGSSGAQVLRFGTVNNEIVIDTIGTHLRHRQSSGFNTGISVSLVPDSFITALKLFNDSSQKLISSLGDVAQESGSNNSSGETLSDETTSCDEERGAESLLNALKCSFPVEIHPVLDHILDHIFSSDEEICKIFGKDPRTNSILDIVYSCGLRGNPSQFVKHISAILDQQDMRHTELSSARHEDSSLHRNRNISETNENARDELPLTETMHPRLRFMKELNCLSDKRLVDWSIDDFSKFIPSLINIADALTGDGSSSCYNSDGDGGGRDCGSADGGGNNEAGGHGDSDKEHCSSEHTTRPAPAAVEQDDTTHNDEKTDTDVTLLDIFNAYSYYERLVRNRNNEHDDGSLTCHRDGDLSDTACASNTNTCVDSCSEDAVDKGCVGGNITAENIGKKDINVRNRASEMVSKTDMSSHPFVKLKHIIDVEGDPASILQSLYEIIHRKLEVYCDEKYAMETKEKEDSEGGGRDDERGGNTGGGRDDGRDGNTRGGRDDGRDGNTGGGRDDGRDGNTGGGRDDGRDGNTGGGRDDERGGNTGGGRDDGRDGNTGGGRDVGIGGITGGGDRDGGDDDDLDPKDSYTRRETAAEKRFIVEPDLD